MFLKIKNNIMHTVLNYGYDEAYMRLCDYLQDNVITEQEFASIFDYVYSKLYK